MFEQFQIPQMNRYLPSMQVCATIQVVKNEKNEKNSINYIKPSVLKVFSEPKFGYVFHHNRQKEGYTFICICCNVFFC
jgi:hypothetical protein